MKKLCIAIFGLLGPALAEAGWVQGTVNAFYITSSDIRVSVTGASAGTCSFWGYEFRIANTSPHYESVLAAVIAAHLSKTNTTVWFTDSTAVGTTQNDGCSENTMAVITSLGMSDL